MSRRFILHPSAFILLSAAAAFAQLPFDLGDWTSYRDFRYARALDIGSQELFIATSGGILEYQLFRQTWRDPMVVGYGFSEAVEIDDPTLLFVDDETGYLWVATRTQWLQYDINAERWRRLAKDLWTTADRVVNIGAGGDSIYLETMPADIFPQLFRAGSPIPSDTWPQYITRYGGLRTFGNLMLDLRPEEPPGVRWRGLRSKRPLRSDELYGAMGLPPAGFPSFIIAPGWIWQTDGTLIDPALRGAPVTDWAVDRWGNLWATFWGAGVLKGDLRSGRAQLYGDGPAGNDIRSILVGDDDLWLAGFNSGDRQGITRASRDLRDWQFFERRDDTRIRSTDVFDMAEWDDRTWFATDDGLLSYQEGGTRWQLYTVQQNLQSNQIRALAATDSELWIGNSRGLCVMTAPGHEIWRIANPGIELNGVNDLAVCRDTLYVGTNSGLFKGGVEDRSMFYAPLDPGLLNAPVLEISVLGSEVWLATAEGVMAYDQSTGSSRSWLSMTWLAHAEPSGVHATSAFVWVGTQGSGFYRFNRRTRDWVSYTTADGLIDNHVQIIRSDGDDLLIGTPVGLTRFYWNRPGRTR